MGSSVSGAIVATLATLVTLQHITRLGTKLWRRQVSLGGTRRISETLEWDN